MSAYIYCPECRDDSLDVDTLCCDCGYNPNKRIKELEEQLAAANQAGIQLYEGMEAERDSHRQAAGMLRGLVTKLEAERDAAYNRGLEDGRKGIT